MVRRKRKCIGRVKSKMTMGRSDSLQGQLNLLRTKEAGSTYSQGREDSMMRVKVAVAVRQRISSMKV